MGDLAVAVAADLPPRRDGVCPTHCDDDCDADCHEAHQVRWKQEHDPATCPGRREAT